MAGNAGKKRKLDPNAQKYYAVRFGVKPGVYLTWPECQKQIAGFKGASYKSFLSRAEADDFIAGRASTADDAEPRFYAVAVGRSPGIYSQWDEASLAVKDCKGPKYKKFDTRGEAIEFIRSFGNADAQQWLQDQGIEPPSKRTKTTASKSTSQTEVEDDAIKVYTDGSSLANGRAGALAGVGVYFGTNDKRNVSEPLQGDIQTNQRAELTAMLRALEKVPVSKKLRIYSDSKYSISCANEWYRSWEAKGWKTTSGEPVKNKDLVVAIRARIDERKAKGGGTFFQWVKGHANDPGNVAADQLAVAGARMTR